LRLEGRDVTREPPAARDATFVFQQYSLYPHLTVYDNLAFPLRSPRASRARGANSRAGSGDRRAASHRGQAHQSRDRAVRAGRCSA
jgi:ABC-type sugar transport system ATPase subunit